MSIKRLFYKCETTRHSINSEKKNGTESHRDANEKKDKEKEDENCYYEPKKIKNKINIFRTVCMKWMENYATQKH